MSNSSEHVGEHAGEHAGEHVGEHGENKNQQDILLKFCIEPKTRQEIQEFLEIKSRSYSSQKVLAPLLKKGLIKLTIPDKPKSSKQKYYSDM